MTRSRDLSDYGSRAGLAQIRPSSVAVGSGSATVSDGGTVTFTGASSVSLNSCFSSTYTNYRIMYSLTSVASDGTFGMRLRATSTDASGTDYVTESLNITQTGTTSSFSTTTGTFFQLGIADSAFNGHYYAGSLDLYRPNEAVPTIMTRISQGLATDSSSYLSHVGSAIHTLSTAYNGFTLLNIGNISGIVQVYGYKL